MTWWQILFMVIGIVVVAAILLLWIFSAIMEHICSKKFDHWRKK